MEMLTAKTPEMVRKDIWAHFLAYNLLRSIMEQSAQKADYVRSQLSLQGTRQLLNQIRKLLATSTKAARQRLCRLLLKDIAADLLPVRPYRQEPRVVKRRPKPFPRMTQPRDLLRARLLA
jgi:predicted metal-dependent HD superfamily phosphohydrolase